MHKSSKEELTKKVKSQKAIPAIAKKSKNPINISLLFGLNLSQK